MIARGSTNSAPFWGRDRNLGQIASPVVVAIHTLRSATSVSLSSGTAEISVTPSANQRLPPPRSNTVTGHSGAAAFARSHQARNSQAKGELQ